MSAASSSLEVAPAPPTVDSDELFHGGQEVVILHKGMPYRLRITRQDKLILTK